MASDCHFFQVALGDARPGCSSSAGSWSYRRDPLPMPSSSGADSFSARVLCHIRWDKVTFIWFSFSLYVHVHSPSIRVQSPSAFTVSRDTKPFRDKSVPLCFPLSVALLALSCCYARRPCSWLCLPCCCPPWPLRDWPWSVVVLEVPKPFQFLACVWPGPALAEAQLQLAAWPRAQPPSIMLARARCSGRSAQRNQVWGSGLASSHR